MRAVVASLDEVDLWHLDCAALPCLALVRMYPVTHGAQRLKLEARLKAEGWSLSPAGVVKLLEPWEGLPERATYALALSAATVPPEEREPIKARLRALSAEGDSAVGPW